MQDGKLLLLQLSAENNALKAALTTAAALMTPPQREAVEAVLKAMQADVIATITASRPNDEPPAERAKEVADAATARACAEILQMLGRMPR